jgi:bifunctional DNase/RNase
MAQMKKIKLEIVGLSHSQTQSGAYALVLGEVEGKRRLPVIIGGAEAQAIAIEIEKMTPSRPLTHDLFKTFAETFQIKLDEVVIYNLVNGIFYAKLICSSDGRTEEIDARTSDAIALAVRFNVPIFTYEFLLSSSGVIIEDGDMAFLENIDTSSVGPEVTPSNQPLPYTKMTDAQLEESLLKAIENESYEKAAKIRDEISRRKAN